MVCYSVSCCTSAHYLQHRPLPSCPIPLQLFASSILFIMGHMVLLHIIQVPNLMAGDETANGTESKGWRGCMQLRLYKEVVGKGQGLQQTLEMIFDYDSLDSTCAF